jgi:predicted HTH transcriptional regulator
MTVHSRQLSACINRSLKSGEADPNIVEALLEPTRTKLRHRQENQFWDYKQQVNWENRVEAARFAKHVLAFHNAGGGLIVIGIKNDYSVAGIHKRELLDSARLRDKLKHYIGSRVPVFQDSIEIPGDRYLWLVFIEGRGATPVPAATCYRASLLTSFEAA